MAVAIGAAALGFFFGQPQTPAPTPAVAGAADKLRGLTLSTPEGKAASLKDWEGKIRVVNFWATWCPPCREEMPEFSAVQQKLGGKGVQIVGIGIDTPDNILAFQKKNPVSYPLLMGSYDTLRLTVELGNTSTALPFTVILDRQGNIAHTKIGKLNATELEKLLTPLYPPAQ
ncbi:MAG: TlpA family protein disulfide reductase [Rhodocyclaceae bacterium]|nr:TlpA family protein disulfide reductase [Rhodocyclaceae bacterium]